MIRPIKNLTLATEHAHAVASAVSDYMSAQNVRYPDRAAACEKAYHEMVDRIEAALNFAALKNG